MSHDQEVLHRELAEPCGIASALRKGRPEGLWDRCRNTFELLIEGGQRARERVVGSFEQVEDSVRLRVAKARLERALVKKCAELGTRVYELAQEPGPADAEHAGLLDDDRVKALLQQIGLLEAAFRKAASERAEGPRAEA